METQRIESGAAIDYQQFMNSAVMEQGRITRMERGFAGSALMVSEDVVTMIAKHDSKRQQVTKKKAKEEPSDETSPKKTNKKPPFVKHTKKTAGRDSEPYKVGDSKTWNDVTWYFCDCPNHREGAHFHPHKAEDCKTRKKWIDGGSKPAANVVDTEEVDVEVQAEGTEEGSARMALAAAFQALHYNPEAQSLVADMLETLSSDE